MSLSIVIPCKNEDETIENTIFSISKKLLNKNIKFEILAVDDFSTDNTKKKIALICHKNQNVKLIENIKMGLGGAISLGIETASNKYLSIMMADLSDDVDDLIKYYELINKNNLDAIFGSRFNKDSKVVDYPKFKYFLNRIFNLIVKIIFFSKFNDFTNAFKIYKVETLKNLMPIVSENFNIFLELPLKIISRGYSYKVISINWYNRKKGKSKFKIKELTSKYIFTLIYCFLEKNLLRKRK
ncbi:MAG: family 2 glycosyl transferase [Euryarchaeota archaeon]|nr:family 2 glycosyl transferase [Euryarchaeota archaeon]|tara:strand:- start:1204 stop:1926 length:723 start_codon:yes stop_codon:yes gene_type:complete